MSNPISSQMFIYLIRNENTHDFRPINGQSIEKNIADCLYCDISRAEQIIKGEIIPTDIEIERFFRAIRYSEGKIEILKIEAQKIREEQA